MDEVRRGRLHPVRSTQATMGRDVVVGWAAPFGPSFAVLARGSATDASGVTTLALPAASGVAGSASSAMSALSSGLSSGLGRELPPRFVPVLGPLGESLGVGVIALVRGGVLVAGIARHDGLARGEEPPFVMAPRVLARGVRTFATHVREDGSVDVALVTEGELRVGRLASAARWTLRDASAGAEGEALWVAPPSRWWDERAATPQLAVALASTTLLVVASVLGSRELVVGACPEGGAVTHVRHALAYGVADFALEGGWGRAGLALLADDGERVEAAFVDARGRFVERPVTSLDVTALEATGARLAAVAVAWLGSAFHLAAWDADTGAVYLAPFHADVAVQLEHVVGPPTLALRRTKLEVVALATDAEDARLVLVRAEPDGRERTPFDVRLAAPRHVRDAIDRARAVELLAEVERVASSTGYRDASETAGTLTMHVEPADGAEALASWRVVYRHDGVATTARPARATSLATSALEAGEAGRVVVAIVVEDAALAVELPTGLERLARWFAERFSSELRRLNDAGERWLRARGEALDVAPVAASLTASSERGASIELVFARLPSAATFARFLSDVRRDVRAGAHRGEASDDAR